MATRRRRRSGAGGGPLKTVAWWALVAMMVIAVSRGMPSWKDPKGIYDWFAARVPWTQQVSDTVSDAVDDTLAGTPGAAGVVWSTDGLGSLAEPAPEASAGRLAGLVEAPEEQVGYDRDEWRHWTEVRGCWTVREAVLVRDAEPGSVVLKDADGKPTSDVGAACQVVSGRWVDPYTGKTFTDPSGLDIDHLVPLGEAARSGGQGWDADRKQAYANDVDDRGHLVAVSAAANRAKGDKDPALWRPANKAAWCSYASSWVSVKSTWSLTVDAAERSALTEMLSGCA